MIDMLLLHNIRSGHEDALEQTIEKYTAYVCTIIRNTAGASLTHEDIEEVASDVFVALWDNANKVIKLKAYIAATARNKAKNKLRDVAKSMPLDERILADNDDAPESYVTSEDERKIVKSAVLNMEDTDREIFLRHYYGSQTVFDISRELGISEATIKQRLVRGRKKLRLIIEKEVFDQ